MNLWKKMIAMRNALGLIVIGLFFFLISLLILVKGNDHDLLMPLAFGLLGLIVLLIGIYQTKKEFSKSMNDYGQYNLVDDLEQIEVIRNENEAMQSYVFHFTGKLNQNWVMKDQDGNVVYEAICEKIEIFHDTAYHFIDHASNQEIVRMIGHTSTITGGMDGHFSANLSSTFTIDQKDVWKVIASQGYGFHFHMNKLAPHYDVKYHQTEAGFIETAGTGLMDSKYKENPLGKIPTKGIYQVYCRPSDFPAFFLICFALSRTEETIS